RQGAAAIRVRETEHTLSYQQPGRAVAETGDHTRQLLARNRRRPVTVEAIGPGRRPRQLTRGESRRMNLNDDVVYRCLRLGPLHQLHPGRSRSLVRHNDRLHDNFLLGHLSLCWICSGDNLRFCEAALPALGAAAPELLADYGPSRYAAFLVDPDGK